MELSRELDDEDDEGSASECEESIMEAIEKEFQESLNQVEEYKKSKTDCHSTYNPTIIYLNDNVFAILLEILEKMLFKAIETNSLGYHKTPFNPMDFIAEQLWNLNPKHPERQETWVNIFDTDWAKELLLKSPRPYFPFSWIWSEEYATLKIQSYMRGYWVRKREDVQELRQFWKALEEDRRVDKELGDLRSKQCQCNKVSKCSIHQLQN